MKCCHYYIERNKKKLKCLDFLYKNLVISSGLQVNNIMQNKCTGYMDDVNVMTCFSIFALYFFVETAIKTFHFICESHIRSISSYCLSCPFVNEIN